MKRSVSTRIRPKSLSRAGFSLIEMIGVLAIIAILAAVIGPKVLDAIKSSRVSATFQEFKPVDQAVTNFVSKYTTLPYTDNNSRLDDLFITTGLMDQRFTPRIGNQADPNATRGATWRQNRKTGTWAASGGTSQQNLSRIICRPSTTKLPSAADGTNYRLDGRTNLPSGSRVVSAVIVNVPIAEALELSQKYDGDSLSATNTRSRDYQGKVVYAAPNGQGETTVYVYIDKE